MRHLFDSTRVKVSPPHKFQIKERILSPLHLHFPRSNLFLFPHIKAAKHTHHRKAASRSTIRLNCVRLLECLNSLELEKYLGTFTANATGKLNVLGHDGNTLGVNGT